MKFSLWVAYSTLDWQPSPHNSGGSWLEGGISPGTHHLPHRYLSASHHHQHAVCGTQAVYAEGCLQAHAEFPSTPPASLSSSAPKASEGAKVVGVGGWHVSTSPSVCTPNQVATVPRLSYNFALHWSRCWDQE